MRVGIPNDQSSSSNDECIMLIDLIDSELQVTPSQKEGQIMVGKCLDEGAPDSFISEIPSAVIPEDGNFCFRIGHLLSVFPSLKRRHTLLLRRHHGLRAQCCNLLWLWLEEAQRLHFVA